jgi:hypothetical protein
VNRRRAFERSRVAPARWVLARAAAARVICDHLTFPLPFPQLAAGDGLAS